MGKPEPAQRWIEDCSYEHDDRLLEAINTEVDLP